MAALGVAAAAPCTAVAAGKHLATRLSSKGPPREGRRERRRFSERLSKIMQIRVGEWCALLKKKKETPFFRPAYRPGRHRRMWVLHNLHLCGRTRIAKCAFAALAHSDK
jgi:hypothetical protein